MAGNFKSGGASKEFEGAPDRPLYDRQPGEPDRAWESFTVYRNMGLSRSIVKAAQHLGKSTPTLEQRSQRYGWRARATEWDRDIDKRKREEDLKAAADMRKRHLRLAMGMGRLAELELLKQLTLAEKKQGKGFLTSGDVVKLAEASTKMERLNRDMPSEIVEERVGLTDLEMDSRIQELAEAVYDGDDDED